MPYTEYQKLWEKANSEKRRQYHHQNYILNRERVLARTKAYRQLHKKYLSECAKKYRLLHKEHIVKLGKIYRVAHKTEIANRMRMYNNTNKARIAERRKQYALANSELVKARRKAVKHRYLGHFYRGGELSLQTVQQVYEDNIKKYGPLTCYLCEQPIPFGADHLEHKTPLSRGGTNIRKNLDVAHCSCNHKKRHRTEKEYRVWQSQLQQA